MLDPQLIYVAVFARPADPDGLAFINEVTLGGTDYSRLGDITGTAEYDARFHFGSAEEVISRFYEALFNREPDAEGLAFWVSNFAPATSGGLTDRPFLPYNIVVAMSEAAQGDDVLTLQAKAAAASLYTASLDTAVEIGAYSGDYAAELGRAFLAPVGLEYFPTQAEVDAAIELQVSSAVSAPSDVVSPDVVTPGVVGVSNVTTE